MSSYFFSLIKCRRISCEWNITSCIFSNVIRMCQQTGPHRLDSHRPLSAPWLACQSHPPHLHLTGLTVTPPWLHPDQLHLPDCTLTGLSVTHLPSTHDRLDSHTPPCLHPDSHPPPISTLTVTSPFLSIQALTPLSAPWPALTGMTRNHPILQASSSFESKSEQLISRISLWLRDCLLIMGWEASKHEGSNIFGSHLGGGEGSKYFRPMGSTIFHMSYWATCCLRYFFKKIALCDTFISNFVSFIAYL